MMRQEPAPMRDFSPVYVRCGSFTSFPPSRRVRFAPRADIRPMPAFMRTHTRPRTARSGPFRFFRLRLWLGCRAARQAHRKHRTLARLARHSHVASHRARELARDGKPKPGAAVAPRGQGVGLGEILEEFCLLLGCHADSTIRD